MTDFTNMRVLAFEAENFAKLKVVSIRPGRHMVPVTGKNRQGKTSVLGALWVALAGARVSPVEPVRHGAERARIRLELGDERPELIVTRRFTVGEDGEFTTDLKVEGADGRKFPKGQEVLNTFLGALTFDPLTFARADDEARLAALRPLVPDVDFDALKAANKTDFEARTETNRKAKEARTRANAIILPPGAVPAAVDVSALEEELSTSAEFNVTLERRQANRDAAIREADKLEEEIAEVVARLETMHERLAELRGALANAETLPAAKDILDLRTQLHSARSGNEVAAKAAQRDALNREAMDAEAESDRLSKAMDKRDADMAAAVAAAVGKVPGLAFERERITLNGSPFDQASDAEQLEASILISGLLNPKLRVIRVRDGSLLDEEALAAVEATAERLDLQVWIERVDSSGAVGFVLEDGEIKGPGTAPAPRPAPAPQQNSASDVEEEAV